MNTTYNILWFEDIDDSFLTLSRRTIKYIESKYLVANIKRIKGAKSFRIEEFDLNDYELIIVDFRLENDTYGFEVIEKIREKQYVNDILFYSSYGPQILEKAMKEYGLQGVFICDRNHKDILDLMKMLIDKSVKRSEDIINMRGIVLDSVSEFDNSLKTILKEIHRHGSEKEKQYLHKKLIRYAKDGVYDRCKVYKKIDARISTTESKSRCDLKGIAGELPDIENPVEEFDLLLSNYFIIESNHLARLIQSMYSEFLKPIISNSFLDNFFENYTKDILQYRNKLAHARKDPTSQDGFVFIDKITNERTIFDSGLCANIRKNIMIYRTNFYLLLQVVMKRDLLSSEGIKSIYAEIK